MKLKKIMITTILALTLGVAANSNADDTVSASMGMGVIGTAPTQPSGTIGAVISPKEPKPFAWNITNINNTFGIRADRPLDLRLLVHAISTIERLYNNHQISGVEYDKLYNHVFKYSSNAACRQIFFTNCRTLIAPLPY